MKILMKIDFCFGETMDTDLLSPLQRQLLYHRCDLRKPKQHEDIEYQVKQWKWSFINEPSKMDLFFHEIDLDLSGLRQIPSYLRKFVQRGKTVLHIDGMEHFHVFVFCSGNVS